ncbi:MAG: hypothetical protein JF885_03520 [Candidatus Dormibacteraeota bacterium]|nr:hypothetical protein [Candidatus Dormibacteraeota bacterium]MBJ7610867.1 hypothetical protein [Candidatus Dormibacteraeota bacterium]
MSYTVEEYRVAAERLWGQAGAFTVDRFIDLNARYFGNSLPPLPIVIGLTAYGKCIGATKSKPALPRISIASFAYKKGARYVEDIVLHEMLHAQLMLAGLNPDHNASPWCAAITSLSPAVLGRSIKAAPVKLRRTGKTVARFVHDGHLRQAELASWPDCLRPEGYYSDQPIYVDSY